MGKSGDRKVGKSGEKWGKVGKSGDRKVGKSREECAKWNTGVIVDFNTNRSVDKANSYNDIRPFSFDERQRAKERKEINNGE